MSYPAIVFVVCLGAISARAGNGELLADTRLDTIVVTAKRHLGVFDDWDLRAAMRIAKKMPGVKQVVNDLEIKLGGE